MSTKHTSFIPMSPSLLPRQKLYEVLELPELPKRLDPKVGMDDPDEKNDHYLQFIRRANEHQSRVTASIHLHQNIVSEPCFLTPFAKIYWHSSRGLRQISFGPTAQQQKSWAV